jgi:putative FmdB family regulatory protein
MPIYEYSCQNCQGRFQKLVQGFSTPAGLLCPRCQSPDIKRAISRFATIKSEEARMEALADPSSLAGLDEQDPRSIAQWAKRMGKQLGEEAGEDWDQMVEEMLEEELGNKDKEGKEDQAGQDQTKPKAPTVGKQDNLGWA